MLVRVAGLVFGLVMVLMGTGAQAQNDAGIAPGTPLKVRAPGFSQGVIAGRFAGIADSMLLMETAAGTHRIPLFAVTEIRHVTGARHRVAEGAALGYLIGSVVGEAVAPSGGIDDNETAAIVALIGTGAGILAGRMIREPRWDALSLRTFRPVPLPGSRVRLAVPGVGFVEGHLLRTADNGLGVRTRNGETVTLGQDDAVRLEWPVAQKRATLRGMGIGALVGTVGGIIVGVTTAEDCGRSSALCFGPGEMAVAFGVALGSVGATLGGIIGHGRRITIWEGSEVPRAHRVAVAPLVTTRSLGVRLTLQ
jgi:hypothetical protein